MSLRSRSANVATWFATIAVPIILFAFDGAALLPGGAPPAQLALELGAGLAGAVFSVNMLTSIADKLISGYLALLFVHVLNRFGFPLADTVRDRLGSLDNLERLLPRR